MSDQRKKDEARQRREFCGRLGAAGAAMLVGAAGGAAAQEGSAEAVTSAAMVYDVRRFGATGKGNNDAAGIQAAINACTAAGGGLVHVPPGLYLSSTISLKDNVTLHLAPNATIKAIPDEDAYVERALVYADGTKNIAVVGQGTLDGTSAAFPGGGFRPQVVQIFRSQHILVEGITIINSASWTVHLCGCDYVNVRGVTVLNDLTQPNADGINPNCCRHVHISDCHLVCGDDCIAVKSTDYLGEKRSCEGVTVTNCTLVTNKTALKIGTETHDDIRDCTFSNIVIRGAARGIGMWIRDGGTIENLSFSNITMDLQEYEGEAMSGEPIRATIRQRHDESPWGRIRDVRISGLTVKTPGRCYIDGNEDHPIENLSISDARFVIDAPLEREQEIHAFEVRHVRGLALRNVDVQWRGEPSAQWRSAMSCENGAGLQLDGFTARQGAADSSVPAVRLSNCRDVFARGCRASLGTGTFLRIEGEQSRSVVLMGSDMHFAERVVDVGDDVPAGEVHQSGNYVEG